LKHKKACPLLINFKSSSKSKVLTTPNINTMCYVLPCYLSCSLSTAREAHEGRVFVLCGGEMMRRCRGYSR